jgi:lysophospholipase L1-like esterase
MRARLLSVLSLFGLLGRPVARMDTTIPVKTVLCYGDSLTAGYFRHGTEFHPYGNILASESGLSVTTVGMSGWTTEQMIKAAADHNAEDLVGNHGDGLVILMNKRHYDLVCLMAGTNDLGHHFSIGTILENIEGLVKYCLTSNASTKVALITVPPNGGETAYETIRKGRAAVNAGLAKIASRHSDRVLLIDTSEALPNPGNTSGTGADLWDTDTLHFSPVGSARLGAFVYSKLVERGLVLRPEAHSALLS